MADAFLCSKGRVSHRTTRLTLQQPMTTWNNNSTWQQQKWKHRFNAAKNCLYIFQDTTQTYTVHRKWRHSKPRLRGRTRGILFHKQTQNTTSTIPPNTQPVNITSSATFHCIGLTHPTKPTSTPSNNNWGPYINNLPTWERQILQHHVINIIN